MAKTVWLDIYDSELVVMERMGDAPFRLWLKRKFANAGFDLDDLNAEITSRREKHEARVVFHQYFEYRD